MVYKVKTKKRKEFNVIVEATDEADAFALKNRIEKYLETADNGDYSGRLVEIK